jgi:acetylornithine deacetylase/succinyl-diaminopimelate desuccinylase-like protein
MFRTSVAIAALFLVGCNAAPTELAEPLKTTSEQAIPSADVSITPDIQAILDASEATNIGYEIVEGLTTEVGPRLAGTEAEARARDWTVEQFNALGLENVRIEPFSIPGWIRGEETATIVSPFPQDLQVTALGGSVATPEGGVTAPIAFFPTYDSLVESDEDLSGKIVFISGRMNKAPDGAGYGPANRKRQMGASQGAKRGALAVVIRSVGTNSHRFPHTGQMRYDPDCPKIPIAALSAPDADQLERMLERGEEIVMRLVTEPMSVGPVESGNVIGEIIGSEKPEEIIVIAGHLDSWDLGTGAIDDGAGIGISAGAAKVILDAGLKPKRTIRVIAFGAEEVGLLGAFEYARKHAADLENHVLATESDFGAEPPYEVLVRVGEGREVVERAAAIMGLPMGTRDTNGGPDIIPMANAGVPVMRFQQDGTDYFDLHHTPNDTLDKIDPADIRINVTAFAVMAWLASEAETDFRADETDPSADLRP